MRTDEDLHESLDFVDDGDLFLDGDVFPRFLRHAFHGRRVSVPRDLLLLFLLLLSDLVVN